MQNNIPSLYILELYSSVAKSAKISTILYHFVPKIKNVDRIAMVIWKMEISLKTGIEHRFSLSKLKVCSQTSRTFGKTKEFHGIFSWNSQIWFNTISHGYFPPRFS